MTTLIDIPSIDNVLHGVRDIGSLKTEKIASTSQVVPTSIFHVCNYLSRETSSLGSSDESKMTSWSFGAITTPDPLWGCHWIFEVMWRSEFSLTISSLKYSTSTSYRALSVTWLDGTLQALSSISIPRHAFFLKLSVLWSHHFVQWCAKSKKSAYSDSSRYDSRRLDHDIDFDDFMITIITYWGRYGTYQNILLMYTQ